MYYEGNNILFYLKNCESRGIYPEIILASVNEIPEFAEEYLELLVEANKRCRVIIVAITTYNNLIDDLSLLGFREFFEKPLTIDKLKAILL